MLASGLPERTELHARNMALVALDMMDVARDTSIDGLDVKVRRRGADDGVCSHGKDVRH